ncbi:MAG: DUF2189 domain-containing protein [Xanthobacteraceae bacterium]
MTQLDIILPTQPNYILPTVRKVRLSDLGDVLKKGWQDFITMPTHVVFLCAIYPIVGLLLFCVTFAYDLLPLIFPLAAGFALVGPFAAIGLYELSRRRELGLDASPLHAFDVMSSPSLGPIAALAAVLVALFATWIGIAESLYIDSFGSQPLTSLVSFANTVMTTPAGYHLIVVGNAVGFLFALVAASISVISFPLLLDRNVGFWAAVLTSLRVVLKNPVTMAAWFLFVAAALLVGSLPFLLGLAIVLPVLGHATWHLYRKAVEPDDSARPEFQPPRPRGKHYAADFPATLFARGEDVSRQ